MSTGAWQSQAAATEARHGTAASASALPRRRLRGKQAKPLEIGCGIQPSTTCVGEGRRKVATAAGGGTGAAVAAAARGSSTVPASSSPSLLLQALGQVVQHVAPNAAAPVDAVAAAGAGGAFTQSMVAPRVHLSEGVGRVANSASPSSSLAGASLQACSPLMVLADAISDLPAEMRRRIKAGDPSIVIVAQPSS